MEDLLKLFLKLMNQRLWRGFYGKIFSVFLDWWMPIYTQEFIPLWVKMPSLKAKLSPWEV